MPTCIEGRVDHHWHEEGKPDRSYRQGAEQVRCCYCDKPAWAIMRRDTVVCGDSSDVLNAINTDEVVSFEPRRKNLPL